MRWIATLVLCAAIGTAQQRGKDSASSRVKDTDKGAWVHGTVLDDISSQPLARAQVMLKPVTGTTNGIAVETDEHGRFVMNRIGAGVYLMMAQRDGYLSASNPRHGALRLPPTIELKGNDHVRDITFRLRPWAVVSGKIKFDDAEPAIGAAVQFYREVVSRGRHVMQIAATGRANDRGEYRVHGLTPGAYIVAASRNRAVAPNIEEHEALDDNGKPLSEYRYATTFYPAAQKLEDAVAVHVESGQEVGGIDIDLKPVPAVRIRGRVVNGLTGGPVIPPPVEFRRMSADGRSSLSVPVDVKVVKDGFEITGVTSGPYLVVAKTEYEHQRLATRLFLLVSDAPIEDLELTLEPEREMSGMLRLDDLPAVQKSGLRVTLEPRSDLNPEASAQVRDDGTFKVKVVPGETYDVYVGNMPAAYYVKSTKVANMDVGVDGISGNAASANVPLELTISAKSGTVYGRAYASDGGMAGGAAIIAVPDPVQGRYGAYVASNADEYGAFFLAGLPPGRYTIFAYYEEPPCDFYDEAALVTCRGRGKSIELSGASQATVEIRMP